VPVLGVAVALVASLVLALGAYFQNHGASNVERNEDEDQPADDGHDGDEPRTARRFGVAQLLGLLRQPRWLLGSGLLTVAVALQLVSLGLAPLAVVQPLGAVALVATAILDARLNHTRVGRRAVLAILASVLGVTAFVVTASFTTSSGPGDTGQELVVLLLLAIVLAVFTVLFAVLHRRLGSLRLALAAGTLFGFVVTLAKVIIDRLPGILASGLRPGDWLVGLCLVALIVAGLAGLYLVQTAYAAGSPDVVVASLTVIDPLVAVSIGIVVLREAAHAPWWAFVLFALSEAVAVVGVITLARHQPAASADPA
jgi:drug/metabolite transporter (DMT)-like permease